MDIRLSQYAQEKGEKYINIYRDFKKGRVEGAYKTESGAIMVKMPELQQNVPQVISIPSSTPTSQGYPTIQLENISIAAETRRNKGFDAERINRFANIADGLIPIRQTNTSNVSVKDAIELATKAYFNFATVRNVIEIMIEFSLGKIFFRKGNAKSRKFFSALLERINIYGLEDGFFREFYRSGNVFIFEQKKKVNQLDIENITKVYGESLAAKKDVLLPYRFIILNPMDIEAQGASDFITPQYLKILNSYELAKLKAASKLGKEVKDNPDKNMFDSLPANIKKQIRDGTTQVQIPLSMDEVTYIGYKRQSYEALAVPFVYPILDPLNFRAALKKMDENLMSFANLAILLVTTGFEGKDGQVHINPNNIAALQTIFAGANNGSVGKVLIHDFSTKIEWKIPVEIATMISSEKYSDINEEIYNGLNYILLGGEKFSNQAGKIQVFLSRLRYGRNLFITEFLNPLIKRISQDLNFKNYPEAYFEDMNDMKDEVEWARIYTRLSEIGFLTPDENFQALENGRLPLNEESIENQREFKKLKDEGLYEQVPGGPSTQKDLLNIQNKQATKTQTTQLEHDDKQGNKQRKHEAENPVTPPPSIHINAPTKSMPAQTGRPSGTKRKKSTNKPRVLGSLNEDNEQTLYSGSKLIEVIKSYDSLEKSVISALLKKHNIEKLSDQQTSIASEISKVIARNSEPSEWNENIEKYLNKPIDDNLDRINEIEAVAAEMQLDPDLAALLYCAQKTEDIIPEKLEDNQEAK